MAKRLDASAVLQVVTVGDPQVAPDGERVAWVRSRIAPERNVATSSLMVQDISKDFAREVLCDVDGLHSPRWSPDGCWIAYLAPHNNATEIFVVSTDGGDSQRVSDTRSAIRNFAWSPNGDAFTLIIPRYLGPEKGKGENSDVLRVTRLRWKRDGIGLIGDHFDHLALLPFDLDSVDFAKPRWLVKGRMDVAGLSWSPSGDQIAFLASFYEQWEHERRSGIYILDIANLSEEPREVASFADTRTQAMSWSPDGKTLSVEGHDSANIGHYGAQRLWLVDVDSGVRQALTSDEDGTLGNAAYSDAGGSGVTTACWLPNGKALICIISRGAHVYLSRVDLNGNITRLSPPDRVIGGFSFSGDAQSVVVVAHPKHRTADLERIDIDRNGHASPPVRISDYGSSWSAGAKAVLPEHFLVDDNSGPPLDAWILMPSVSLKERVPVILYCGGGPGGMRSDNLHVEWQIYAAAGYAVVWVNTRGCQGYGDSFCTAILGSWGESDFTDNMRGLEAALDAYPQLNPNCLAIAGGSYGGYQVAWALGHTHRFRAAVADRVVVDKLAAFGTSDIGPLRAFEFGDKFPWDDPKAYLRQSPINTIGGVQTPTLIVHSAQDHRCTVEQGEALYTALALQEVDVRLVRFPNESHGLSRGGRPWHRVRRIQEYLDWFATHLLSDDGHEA